MAVSRRCTGLHTLPTPEIWLHIDSEWCSGPPARFQDENFNISPTSQPVKIYSLLQTPIAKFLAWNSTVRAISKFIYFIFSQKIRLSGLDLVGTGLFLSKRWLAATTTYDYSLDLPTPEIQIRYSLPSKSYQKVDDKQECRVYPDKIPSPQFPLVVDRVSHSTLRLNGILTRLTAPPRSWSFWDKMEWNGNW